jgi:hypothetical protein
LIFLILAFKMFKYNSVMVKIQVKVKILDYNFYLIMRKKLRNKEILLSNC